MVSPFLLARSTFQGRFPLREVIAPIRVWVSLLFSFAPPVNIFSPSPQIKLPQGTGGHSFLTLPQVGDNFHDGGKILFRRDRVLRKRR